MRIPRNQYRIVRDNYLGYEVQVKWWWSFRWHQKGFSNTFSNVEEARKYALDGHEIERGEI